MCNAAVYFPNAHKEGVFLPGLFPGGGPRWSAEGEVGRCHVIFGAPRKALQKFGGTVEEAHFFRSCEHEMLFYVIHLCLDVMLQVQMQLGKKGGWWCKEQMA